MNPHPWRVSFRIVLAASLLLLAFCTWSISVNLRARSDREYGWVEQASWAELKAEAPARLRMVAAGPEDDEESYRLAAIRMVSLNHDQELGAMVDFGGCALAGALVSLMLLVAMRPGRRESGMAAAARAE